MHRDFRNRSPGKTPESAAEAEYRLFVKEIFGVDLLAPSAEEAKAQAKREQLEWAATISTRAEDELRRLQREEAAAAERRQLVEWVASISEPSWGERSDIPVSPDVRESVDPITGFDAPPVRESNWNPADHPRTGSPPNRGWWASKGGGAGGSGAPADASDPSRWYLPSDDKGRWISGKKGEGIFRLNTPVDVNGKMVRDIKFKNGAPILDGFTLPGKTATIVLTGDGATDIRNAEEAWKKLNPGKELPRNATFHHDLLHATEHTVIIDGKKTKVLVGKMPLIPTAANQAVFHEGTAAVGKKYYHGLATDTDAVKALAKKEASLAGDAGSVVAKAAKKIKPGQVAKGILPFVGRNVVRAIPLVGTGLAIAEFADNVKAHGVGGAVARATPVLGDLMSAHDLGSALADDIKTRADQRLAQTQADINRPVDEAGQKANEQTIKAYNELAPQIRVTNNAYEGQRIVDPHEVVDALQTYRDEMATWNHVKAEGSEHIDYEARAAESKEKLKKSLIRASQPPEPKPQATAT
jgi:hypothetical protein